MLSVFNYTMFTPIAICKISIAKNFIFNIFLLTKILPFLILFHHSHNGKITIIFLRHSGAGYLPQWIVFHPQEGGINWY